MDPLEPLHLRPTAALAPRVLLPGDPGRALLLAQVVLEAPKMFNHHRGLWGYTGASVADGEPLTIQATGMGGPSVAIVVEDLIRLGAARFVRVGTCTGVDASLALGDVLVATEALAEDGASRALGAVGRVAADAGIAAELARTDEAARRGAVRSTDLLVSTGESGPVVGEPVADVLAADLETAALFQLAIRRGVAAGAVLIVGATPDGARIEDDSLDEAARRAGQLAVAGLPPGA